MSNIEQGTAELRSLTWTFRVGLFRGSSGADHIVNIEHEISERRGQPRRWDILCFFRYDQRG